jgi:lipooligosaccharide transport system permease protein
MSASAFPERAAPKATRRHGMSGILPVLEHHWLWYRRNWRATVVSSVLQPLLFLFAFGVGFGALVDRGAQAQAATGGVAYLAWLAPALVAVSAVQAGVMESTYPILSGFKWQRIYHAMAAGPITPSAIALGQLGWVAAKNLATGLVFVAVVALVGGAAGPGILLAVLAAVLGGLAVAGPTSAFAAGVENEGGSFTGIFRFVVVPMTLFSGTFFPVDRLPVWVRPLAWVSPLWHSTELARAAALWRPLPLLAALGHLGYLLALFAVGAALTVRRFGRRLAP